MKIYIAHTKRGDFRSDLYTPLRESRLGKFAEIIFPHDESDDLFDSKTELQTVDWVIAEVSYPSTGMGIELGWADGRCIPIIAIQNISIPKSASIAQVAKHYFMYTNSDDFIKKIEEVILSF